MTSTPITASPVKGGTLLLLVDVQNDFHPGGSLAIPSASDDAERIADLIRRGSTNSSLNPRIDRIVATLDSHHRLHIAHPKFWVSGEDDATHPSPFTIISSSDIEAGKWKPRKNLKLPVDKVLVSVDILRGDSDLYFTAGKLDLMKYCIEYTKLLESKGRFQLCIWPEHCIIGTKGHCIVENVHNAFVEWSDITGGSVEWVAKGENLMTEMYSALSAEVPISSDTLFNKELYESIMKADRVLVAGQAASHCVNYTLRDIVECTPEGERGKICLLTDCTSAVPCFEAASDELMQYCKNNGVNTCTSSELFNS